MNFARLSMGATLFLLVSLSSQAMTAAQAHALMQQAKAGDSSAISSLMSAANSGDRNAEFGIGFLYYYGFGLNGDAVQGVEWFRKAAEQGDANAQNSLGFAYITGRGVAKDVAKAKFWWEQAAAQGNAAAARNLESISKTERQSQ